MSTEPADSMKVRMAIAERVRRGELTLKAAQAELRRIRRRAKEAGETTYFEAITSHSEG